MCNIVDNNANQVVSNSYKEYAKYVLETRALASTCDGLKQVQRRIIYGASKLPMKLMKTAALAGEIMKLHPHAEASGQIYTMTFPGNSQKIFNIKGNHGGYGWSASASRYTECYLNEIGRFNYCQFLDYAEYEEGELGIPEPKALPCLVPYGIVEGSSGMGVGISSNLMPLNLLDLIRCYKNYISTGVFDGSEVRPDPGPFLIETDLSSVIEAVNSSRGKITTIPIIVKESPTKVSMGRIPGRSIDSLLSKLGWWITDGYVEFTNESSDQIRYTFEIVDDKKGEITIDSLIYYLEKYGRSNTTYSRCMVDDDKSAIYCSLQYVMDKSLATLNRAIDKWIDIESQKLKKRLSLYESLKKAKKLRLFDNIAKDSTEDLINKLVASEIDIEIAKEIVKKPISYLTRDHDYEMNELFEKLKEFDNHDRTEYLLTLYNKFESMILEDHESKKHALMKSDLLKKPKIRLLDSESVEVYQDRRQGYDLGEKVYLVGKSGWLYIRAINSPVKSIIHLGINEPIVGVSTDRYKYLEVQTQKNKRGLSYETSSLDKERYLVKLDDNEEVVLAQGWNHPPKSVTDNLVKRISQARRY